MKLKIPGTPILLIAIGLISFTTADKFPVKEWTSAVPNRPLMFYISGDGGMNSFSTSLCETLNKRGFDVAALNAKDYFWDKKTPEQTATDVSNFLISKLTGRKDQRVVLIGYSFGADVLPFVLNRMPPSLASKIVVSYIMASSGSTDFEIHVADMFGKAKRRGVDVVTEINKIKGQRIVIVNGSDEQDLDLSKITLQKYTHEVIPGGHHFEGNINQIANVIVKDID